MKIIIAMLRRIKATKSKNKILYAKLIAEFLSFSKRLEKIGIKTEAIAPSPKILLNIFGIRNAAKKISPCFPEPKKYANTMSLTNPVSLERRVKNTVIMEFLKINFILFILFLLSYLLTVFIFYDIFNYYFLQTMIGAVLFSIFFSILAFISGVEFSDDVFKYLGMGNRLEQRCETFLIKEEERRLKSGKSDDDDMPVINLEDKTKQNQTPENQTSENKPAEPQKTETPVATETQNVAQPNQTPENQTTENKATEPQKTEETKPQVAPNPATQPSLEAATPDLEAVDIEFKANQQNLNTTASNTVPQEEMPQSVAPSLANTQTTPQNPAETQPVAPEATPVPNAVNTTPAVATNPQMPTPQEQVVPSVVPSPTNTQTTPQNPADTELVAPISQPTEATQTTNPVNTSPVATTPQTQSSTPTPTVPSKTQNQVKSNQTNPKQEQLKKDLQNKSLGPKKETNVKIEFQH